jgi:DNA-binding beta-propeller fold protein YncE
MRTAPILALATSLAALCGCLPDTSGIDPPGDRLIYPVGLSLTTDNQILLAVNSNFDLEYNAGTLTAMNVSNLEAELTAAESEVSKDGKYLYISDSKLIYEQETIRLGAFASDLDLTPAGDRAIIPIRGERAIILVDVGDTTSGNLLDCGEGKDLHCDGAHRVESNDDYTLPIEPYEVASLDYTEPNGETTTLGFATHLAGGQVSLFVIRDGLAGSAAPPELIRVLSGVVPGASGIAVNRTNRDIYVAGRRDPDPHVAVLRVLTDSQNGYFSHNPFFNQVDHIDIGDEMYAGTDARGIAVSPGGELAYLVVRSPPALLELDLASYEMTELTSMCTEPSVVELYEDDMGTPGIEDDVTYAFVLCFVTSQVFIVNTKLNTVVWQSTGSGPHAIAFDKSRRLAYIANFRESTISVIRVEPPIFDHLRDPEGRVVKIGKPRLPKGHD